MKDCLKLTRLDILSVGWAWLIGTLIYTFMFNLAIILFAEGDFSLLCASSQVTAMFTMWSFFIFQERDKVVLLYGSLPVSSNKIVLGRYISMISICGIFFIKDIIIYIYLVLFGNWHWDFFTILQGGSLSLLVFAIVSTAVPPMFKFGLMKGVAWFAALFFVFLMTFCILIAMDVLPQFFVFWHSNKVYFCGGAILLSCIILYVSYRMAAAAYRTKSWT